MYLGRLGPAALGGAGTAIAAQYSVAKLANDPLLRTSISLVARCSSGPLCSRPPNFALARSTLIR